MREISSGFVKAPDLSLCASDSLHAAVFDRATLLAHVLDGFALRRKGPHGPSHWARVRLNALQVGKVRKADLLVVELFAFLHDSQRMSEGQDPGHGALGAEFARSLNHKYFELTSSQLDKLCEAIRFHSDGYVHDDATIQSCWDGDRMDLGRVGIKPSLKYLSTEAAPFLYAAYKRSCFPV